MWPLAGATLCLARIDPQKEKKNLRECCKYLTESRLDGHNFGGELGDVLICDVKALEQRMEEDASSDHRKGL